MGKETKKIKIVVDTNIFISAIGWNGCEKLIIKACTDGIFKLLISEQILEEIKQVLNYSKFYFIEKAEKDWLFEAIDETACFVKPVRSLNIIKEDSTDNKFLECAVEAKADFIISGDRHLLNLKEFQGIKILRATNFLNRVL